LGAKGLGDRWSREGRLACMNSGGRPIQWQCKQCYNGRMKPVREEPMTQWKRPHSSGVCGYVHLELTLHPNGCSEGRGM
jgi:hypothetical protein